MYKILHRSHVKETAEALERAAKAERITSRAVKLAEKAQLEERPLDFLARFVAFNQVHPYA